MAIINSLVMGKARGSIGNVTLAVLKGQTIAKQKIVNPTPSAKEGQVLSRGKMSNAVLAWQFLSLFLVFTSAFAKKTESTYNAFIRIAKNSFSAVVQVYGYLAAQELVLLSIYQSMIATIDGLTVAIDEATVIFATNGIPYSTTLHVRIIVWNGDTGANQIFDRVVTSNDYLAGTVTLTYPDIDNTKVGAYLYDSLDKKCSNVLFSEA